MLQISLNYNFCRKGNLLSRINFSQFFCFVRVFRGLVDQTSASKTVDSGYTPKFGQILVEIKSRLWLHVLAIQAKDNFCG